MQKKNDNTEIRGKVIFAFRYVCHGCTQPAAYAENTEDVKSCTCPHCHKTQECKPENWVLMGETEKAQINARYGV